MTELTLLTRAGCHLCDTMKAVVARAQEQYPVRLREIDITTRPDLEREYGDAIPVLLWGDHVVARSRISASQLVTALRARSAAQTRKGG